MTTVAFTQETIDEIMFEAKQAAYSAADSFFRTQLNGVDQGCCGFAWVEIFEVRSNSKLGKALQLHGFRKSHTGGLQNWNPSKLAVQNIDTLEEGADAFAKVLQKYGFKAFACSRLD